jgi:hypothetical protein
MKYNHKGTRDLGRQRIRSCDIGTGFQLDHGWMNNRKKKQHDSATVPHKQIIPVIFCYTSSINVTNVLTYICQLFLS